MKKKASPNTKKTTNFEPTKVGLLIAVVAVVTLTIFSLVIASIR